MTFEVPYVGGPLDGSCEAYATVPASQQQVWTGAQEPCHYVLFLIELAGITRLIYVAHGLPLDTAIARLSERLGLPQAAPSILGVGRIDAASAAAAELPATVEVEAMPAPSPAV